MLKTKMFFSETHRSFSLISNGNVLSNTFDISQIERIVHANVERRPNNHPLLVRLRDEYRKMTNTVPSNRDLELIQILISLFNSAQAKYNVSELVDTTKFYEVLNETHNQILMLNRSGYHGFISAIEAIIREILNRRNDKEGEEVLGVVDFVIGIILLLHSLGRIIAGPPPKDIWDAVAVIGLAIIGVALIVIGVGP